MKKLLKKTALLLLAFIIVLSSGGCAFLEFLINSLDNPSKNKNLVDGTPHTLEIVVPEGRYHNLTDGEYVECYLVVNGGWLSADAYDIEWKVNESVSSTQNSLIVIEPSTTNKKINLSATLTYEDETVTYEEEKTKQLQTQTTIVFYDEVPTIEVNKEETGLNTRFAVNSELVSDNIVEWFVNGELVKEGASYIHDNTRIGKYEVSLTINGNPITIDEPIIKTSGAVKPTGIKVDYDTYYPNIEVSWNDVAEGEYEVVILNNSTTVTTTQNSYLFTLEQFPINVDSVQFKIRSNGDGDAYLQSDYVTRAASRLNATQIEYLNKSYGIENAYLTSDEEFFIQFEHIMLSRVQPIAQYTQIERSFYIAFDLEGEYGSIVNLRDEAFDRACYAGLYSISTSYQSLKKIATVNIEFKTVNQPNVSNLTAPSNYSNNLNGYDLNVSQTGRDSEVLPIDSWTKTLSVDNTDAMVRAVELGYRPTFDAESICATYYAKAREVLHNITDESMSEYDIALAVYDWIMYSNNYNNDVTTMDTDDAVKSPAFYLEGVLTDGYSYAVCDGIAKTYSLLCNMAGVQTVRITGMAGYNSDMGPHAWNKIKVDGQWYVVDATWGDLTMSLAYKLGFSARTMTRELGTHSFFLLSDADVAFNHVEDDSGYPKTAPISYGYYEKQKLSYNDEEYDCYITHADEIVATTSALASFIKTKIGGSHSVTDNMTIVSSSYYLFEIKYNPAIKSEVYAKFKSNGTIANAIRQTYSSYSFCDDNGTILIIVSSGGNTLTNNSLTLA